MDLLNTHPIKKSDLGFHGNLFGGKLLAWLDASAASYAMQVCDTPRMVTVTMDKCVWEKPAGPSHVIKIYAEVVRFGNTSVTLLVEARRHNVYNGKQQRILATDIKFVSVDEDGNAIPISEKVKKKYLKKESNE